MTRIPVPPNIFLDNIRQLKAAATDCTHVPIPPTIMLDNIRQLKAYADEWCSIDYEEKAYRIEWLKRYTRRT